ncbi:MAG: phage portal protein [Bryobacteraceae bacterium]
MSYFRNLARATRGFSRALLGVPSGRGYDASGYGRRLAAWVETNSAINELLSTEGEELRRRSRALVRKNGWATSAQDSYVANAVGTGIKPQSLHPDEEIRKRIDKAWSISVDEFDSDGLTDFYGLEALALREIFEGGEVLGRFRPRRSSDGLFVPLQLQLLEAEHLPLRYNTNNGNNPVRAGIEFTPWGKREAYHMYSEHPGSGAMALTADYGQLKRVPASEVIHCFQPLRAGQYRGQPWLAPVMVTLYELDQFVDAVLVRQKLSNMFVGTQRLSNPDNQMFPEATGTGEIADAGTQPSEVQPGTILDIGGDEMNWNDPPDPAATFPDFLKVMLHAFASGAGIPYELITWDLREVNYSSMRAALLEFRRRVEQLQFNVLAFQFCRPIWRRWINDAVLAGVLPRPQNAEGWRDLYSVEWRTPKWAWVDPLKDVQAAVTEIRNGLSSRTAKIHETGYDPEQIDRERAQDNARDDALGLVSDSDPRKTQKAAAPTAEKPSEPDERETDDEATTAPRK